MGCAEERRDQRVPSPSYQHATQVELSAPFQTRVLPETETWTREQLHASLPASYRIKIDRENLAAPQPGDILAPLKEELDLSRLEKCAKWLWIAGRPIPPRPIHYQRLLGRDIVLTEQIDLHLVWTSGRIYLKPLARFLLEPRVWSEYLSCQEGCGCYTGATATYCDHRALRRGALGFLFSYAALIRHESDLALAVENRLVPCEIDWAKWRHLVAELLVNRRYGDRIYDYLHERFYYGELRLSRLNKLQYLNDRTAYIPPWNRYGDFIYDNLTWLASVTVYIAVVLTAMQVGLATTSLSTNETFQAASYGFTIFSILGLFLFMFLLFALFVCIFVRNWIRTVAFKRERLAGIMNSS